MRSRLAHVLWVVLLGSICLGTVSPGKASDWIGPDLEQVFAREKNRLYDDEDEPQAEVRHVWQVGVGILEIRGEGLARGAVARFAAGDQFVNILGFERKHDISLDQIYAQPQETIAAARTTAYIPCYLEMEIIGNTRWMLLESYGPGSRAELRLEDIRTLTFASEIGGFVDRDWNFLGAGSNLQVRPQDGYYIQGCDIFSVRIWSNDNYLHLIRAEPLRMGSRRLPLEMRSSEDGVIWGEEIRLNGLVEIGRGNALEERTWFHQFRVPYDTSVVAGTYQGQIVFKAVTI